MCCTYIIPEGRKITAVWCADVYSSSQGHSKSRIFPGQEEECFSTRLLFPKLRQLEIFLLLLLTSQVFKTLPNAILMISHSYKSDNCSL